jgi:ribonuclease Z
MENHTLPAEAGQIFSTIKPKLAAYTHVLLFSLPNIPAPTPAELIAETRKTYDGPLAVGADLMTFELTGLEVKVIPFVQ